MSRSSLTRTLCAAALALPLLAACSHSRLLPRADYAHGPLPHQMRRHEDYANIDRLSWLRHEVYRPVKAIETKSLSPDQDLCVREFGPPAFERTFKTGDGEHVLEWLNIENDLCFQFIDGEMVFQGPVRDLEHTLLRQGRPNDVTTHIAEPGIERLHFIYLRWLNPERLEYDFADGEMIYEEHFN